MFQKLKRLMAGKQVRMTMAEYELLKKFDYSDVLRRSIRGKTCVAYMYYLRSIDDSPSPSKKP